MFGPERAGQMVFDTPLLGKGAWGACEAMSVLHRLRLSYANSIFCQIGAFTFAAGGSEKGIAQAAKAKRARRTMRRAVDVRCFLYRFSQTDQPFSPLRATPRTIWRCSARNRIMIGMIASVEPAIGSSCWLLSCTHRLAIAIGSFSSDTDGVTTQPQLIRNSERGQQEFSLSPYVCVLGGRAFGPPLCRGCAPATPPSKTIPHRPCVRIPAVPLHQPGCRKPNTQSDSQNGGSDKGLVKTDTVDGLVVTRWVKRLMRRSHLRNQAHGSSPNSCLPSPVNCPGLPNFCSSSRGSPG